MSRIRPSILFIGVLVCTPLLALTRFGLFRQVSESVQRLYEHTLRLPAEALVTPGWLSYGYYTVMAFACSWVCVTLPKQAPRYAFIMVLCFLTLTLSPLLALNGILFEPFSGLMAILAAGLAGLVASGTERGQRLRSFRTFFLGRLTEDQFDQLIEDKEPVALTSKRDVTSLTCRILNTDKLSHNLLPDQLDMLSSSFMKAVAEFLVTQGGYLDVCNAHGITVQFGFPVKNPQHALQAGRVALALRTFLQDLSGELERRWGHMPVIGVGLSSGSAVCGLIGYHEFQFYSVLGEPPDMSRRLCHMSGVYGSPVLISASTFNAIRNQVEVRPMEMLAAPGQTAVSEVYELLCDKGHLSPPEAAARDAFWEGVVALRKGDAKTAVTKLMKAESKGHHDPAREYFLERAQALQAESRPARRVDDMA